MVVRAERHLENNLIHSSLSCYRSALRWVNRLSIRLDFWLSSGSQGCGIEFCVGLTLSMGTGVGGSPRPQNQLVAEIHAYPSACDASAENLTVVMPVFLRSKGQLCV